MGVRSPCNYNYTHPNLETVLKYQHFVFFLSDWFEFLCQSLSIGNWALYSRMLLYLHHRNSKLYFHPAKFDKFKDEKISDDQTVSGAQSTGVYRRSIFKIRPNILIGLQKLRLRPKDQSRSRLFIYLNFLRWFSWFYLISTNFSLVVEF